MPWDHMSEFIGAAGKQNRWTGACQFSAFPQQPLARSDFFTSKAARGHLLGIKTTVIKFLKFWDPYQTSPVPVGLVKLKKMPKKSRKSSLFAQ